MSVTAQVVQNFTSSQSSLQPVPVALAAGDGIGPEISQAVCRILDAAGSRASFVPITVGERSYLDGVSSGVSPEAWATLREHRVLLKGPISTPQGGGYKSVNVTLRKSLGLFANIRPCRSWHPWVATRHPDMDVLIVRENEEDTYAGIEHRQTAEVTQCLKLITQPGSERVIRYAFELARAQGRRKVHCFTKDNIMKITDGLFHQTFDRIAAEYPDIESSHLIIDIGTALLADRPEMFDLIVAPNLYGDIISDVAAQITGSVGLGGSANIGPEFAMFEAVHGSAPDIAGQDIANPSGMLLAAVDMLRYIGDTSTASRIHAAWRKTLAEGLHTADIHRAGHSRKRLGTQAFADAIIERLDRSGAEPGADWPRVHCAWPKATERPAKRLVGVDVFLDHDGRDPERLGRTVEALTLNSGLTLSLITNRGVKVYPNGLPETCCTDHWRCRFRSPNNAPIEHRQIIELLEMFEAAGLDFIKTEHLYTFDGQPGFSLGQGE
ncbi:NADP-dependent isocitrate dehydrogenase [Wenzhouxiangella limi]|uniref:Isocitrate dehydrogenase [NADP] n=1 Tax=Wenzhouxiangella limi TaxID=2707351 RepID=A0A845VEB8_9GAMM|nr:NADP-dependent isocitrate dehydrogenase [Wenzhouxiangella limi]NDY95599.1 NADP-dependent isocitrate dehydrogenase [Wenzhouxiangella limi]